MISATNKEKEDQKSFRKSTEKNCNVVKKVQTLPTKEKNMLENSILKSKTVSTYNNEARKTGTRTIMTSNSLGKKNKNDSAKYVECEHRDMPA